MDRIITIRNTYTPKNNTRIIWQGCILDMNKSYPDNIIYGIWDYSREEVLEACLGKAVMMDLKEKKL